MTRCPRAWVTEAVLSLVLAIAGCSSVRQGGAPEPSFHLDTDIQQLAEQFQTSSSIKGYFASPAKSSRDAFITGRLVLIDLRYLQFIRTITADKQQLDSAADILTLTLNLAGTLTGSSRVKSNLAAVAAGVTGGKATIDKHYYHEKSIDALVATMNARRKEVLTRILEGLALPLERYSFTEVVTDLHTYYLAGTLAGAIQFIQAEAGKKEAQSDEQIKELRRILPFSAADIDLTGQLTDAIGALMDTDSDLARAKAALRALGTRETDLPTTTRKARDMLKIYVRMASNTEELKKVRTAFESAKLVAPTP